MKNVQTMTLFCHQLSMTLSNLTRRPQLTLKRSEKEPYKPRFHICHTIRFQKSSENFPGGARETLVTRVTIKRVLSKPRSFSGFPAFLRANSSIILTLKEFQLSVEFLLSETLQDLLARELDRRRLSDDAFMAAQQRTFAKRAEHRRMTMI